MSTDIYAGIAFSPKATLTDSIGSSSSIIPVSDVSVFPEAPNFATIGSDENGETIMYSAKTDSALSGCTRGVEGTAKSWLKGEAIARNFTNKDFEAIRLNIVELLKKVLTGAKIDEDGNLILSLQDDTEFNAGNAKGGPGEKGDQGDPGPKGDQGAPGQPATINGKQAITIEASGGLSGSQVESTYKIDGSELLTSAKNYTDSAIGSALEASY